MLTEELGDLSNFKIVYINIDNCMEIIYECNFCLIQLNNY